MTEASIIIPHYGDDDLLDRCISAVEATVDDPHWIVSNSNVTGNNFAQACNDGAHYADLDSEVLVFLNNDTVVQPGWLEPLLDKATRTWPNGATGIAGAQLRYPGGRVQHAGVDIFRTHAGVEARHADPVHAHDRRFVPAVTGAVFAVNTLCWEDVGGFDMGFDNGYEDVDFCLRAGKLGWSVVYEPDSVVIHAESVSGAARWRSVRQNIDRLNRKWAADSWLTPLIS